MSFAGGLLKKVTSPVMGMLGGGGSGMNFQAQTSPLMQGANAGQATDMYGNVVSGIDQQQAFLNALQGQNGLQNQADVYSQMQGIANGTGPNPAMAQLNNATGQNVANQAALMAGQRGASANAGLLARQIGQQGANIQQNAVGQGAALQAQQQMNALGAMGNIAGSQVGQQANALNAYNSAAQGAQNNVLGAIGNYNSSMSGQQNAANQANAGIAAQNAKSQAGLMGGLLGAAGTVFGGPIGGAIGSSLGSSLGKAHGGMIQAPNYMDGLMAHFNAGAVVPGQAAVSGDSARNDTVPAMLSPKEIVIPRSITMSPDAPKKAMAFVEAVLARNGMRGKK